MTQKSRIAIFLCLSPPPHFCCIPNPLLQLRDRQEGGGKKNQQTKAMLYFMLTAAFDLKMMSHWVSWSAYYGVMDGCQSGGGWQIAMGGGEQMPGDFRGFSGAQD